VHWRFPATIINAMKSRSFRLLALAFGAAVFFGAGVFSGQRWFSKPAGSQAAPVTSEKRLRTASKFRSVPFADNDDNNPQNDWRSQERVSSQARVDRLERKVSSLSVQFESIRNLTDERLIAAMVELHLTNSTMEKIFPEYQAETAQLDLASQSGFGQNHPKIRALKQSLDTKYAQLLEASESLKCNLGVQLKEAQQMLEEEKTRLSRTQERKGKSKQPMEIGKKNPGNV